MFQVSRPGIATMISRHIGRYFIMSILQICASLIPRAIDTSNYKRNSVLNGDISGQSLDVEDVYEKIVTIFSMILWP